jgi:branched-chain amino acid aminotransferase
MAAGTAAALVPIRSITRRCDPSATQSISSAVGKHHRLSSDAESETVTYIADEEPDAGPLCLRLLKQLQGIQLGKVKDEFGWCFGVTQEDGAKASVEAKASGSNGQTVDQLD